MNTKIFSPCVLFLLTTIMLHAISIREAEIKSDITSIIPDRKILSADSEWMGVQILTLDETILFSASASCIVESAGKVSTHDMIPGHQGPYSQLALKIQKGLITKYFPDSKEDPSVSSNFGFIDGKASELFALARLSSGSIENEFVSLVIRVSPLTNEQEQILLNLIITKKNPNPYFRFLEHRSEIPNVSLGDIPPDILAKDTVGNEIHLSRLKDKVVLLNFTATWCGPCKSALPGLLATYEKYRDKDVEFISIFLEDAPDEAIRYIKEQRIPWPTRIETKGWKSPSALAYGIRKIPTNPLIVNKRLVSDDEHGIAIEREIQKYLERLTHNADKAPVQNTSALSK